MSYAENTRIYLTPDGLCSAAALHELAHVLVRSAGSECWLDPGRFGSDQFSRPYGPLWQRTYAAVVSAVVGAEVGAALAEGFSTVASVAA